MVDPRGPGRQADQRHIEEMLREIEIRNLQSMLEGQEHERKRISQDLHDRLGGMLSAIKMQFASLETPVKREGKRHEERQGLVLTMLDSAVSEVRRISHDLTQGTRSGSALGPALLRLQRAVQAAGGAEVELNLFDLEGRIEQHTEIITYLIIHELVGNVLKHAKADHLTVQVTRGTASINVIVEDNGIGFEPLKVSPGHGLSRVRAYAAELGGVMLLDPGSGRGTSVSIDIPLASRPRSSTIGG